MYHNEGECIILHILSVCQCIMVKESVLVYKLEYMIVSEVVIQSVVEEE